MRTDFFNRKKWRYIVFSQALAIMLLGILVCVSLHIQPRSLRNGKNFCFLVSKQSHIQAGMHEAQLNGGAGYLLSHKGREYVALSVYLKVEEGERITCVLKEQGEEVELCMLTATSLQLSGKGDKERMHQEAIDCLYGCMQVLEQEIVRLDRGATQQSSLKIIKTLIRQFSFLAKKYTQNYPAFTKVCLQAKKFLEECANPILYVRDLRYLLCDLCVSYVDLASA